MNVVDADGDTVGDERPITIALIDNPSGATLGGTAAVTSEDGVATFSSLTLDRPGTAFTLRASTPDLESATSDPFSILSIVAGGTGKIYAVTTSNALVSFDAITPDRLLSTKQLHPLATTEKIVGIDFRPSSGVLFAVAQTGTNGKLYTVNMATGELAAVGSMFSLVGTTFGVNFNPAADKIRVVSNTGISLRLDPATGALAGADTNLAFAVGDAHVGATPNVVAVAYDNNIPGVTGTGLYGIDATLGVLVRVGGVIGDPSPNLGQLTTIGMSNSTPIGSNVGFDIAGPGSGSGTAFATFAPTGGPVAVLCPVNLATAALGTCSPISVEDAITAIAVDSPLVYAVSDSNTLITFNAQRPGTLLSAMKFTGLQASETVAAIDFRPATGELYALGSSSRIYKVNTGTGALTSVGDPLATPIAGAAFALEFDPALDAIRILSDTGQNLSVNARTAAILNVDTPLTPAPHVVAAAFSGNLPGIPGSVLYAIDSTSNNLVAIPSPSAGTIAAPLALGIDIADAVGFDIGVNGMAYLSAVATPATAASLYSVNLITGAATAYGTIGAPGTVTALAVPAGTPLTAYGIAGVNDLVRFNPWSAGVLEATTPITGLSAAENIVGIDARPAGGGLFAITNQSRLYTINTETGAAAQVGNTFVPTLTGDAWGMDFNPVVDRIRVVSRDGQNLRVSPIDGAVTMDTALTFPVGDPNAADVAQVVGIAYTNNDTYLVNDTAMSRTTLYAIDVLNNSLVRFGSLYGLPSSPNTGLLTTVGVLSGVTATANTSFDIGPNGTALISDGTALSVVNLALGLTVSAGPALPTAIRAFAIRR